MLHRLKRRFKETFLLGKVYTETISVTDSEVLSGRVALITGGSRGIGLGIAKEFVRQGAKVVITGRQESSLIEACKMIQKNIGIDSCIDYMVWDHSKANLISEKFEEAVGKFGYIDILINNAGYHGNQNFLTISEKDYDQTFDVNIKNVFFMSQKFMQYAIDNKITGNICNIISASSMKPAWSPYEISKWACRGFTRGLAREAAPYGIVVNAIAPGPAATAMTHWENGDSLSWPAIPKGRLVVPEEIGGLAVFLVSGMGRCIVGETVFCDGGSGLLTANK